MATVHVFVATGTFRSERELRQYVDAAYTTDGDMIASAFMRETRLSTYEPDCIEVVWSERRGGVREHSRTASYSEQWLSHVSSPVPVDAAVCAFSPNALAEPEACTRIRYLGAYAYEPRDG